VIIEGLLTSSRSDDSPHVAPMGPVVDEALTNWLLRPFQSSNTFKLLRNNGCCIFHVMDDVLPIVQAALGFEVDVEFKEHATGGWIVKSACHWYKLKVVRWDVSTPRSEAVAVVVETGFLKPFWGWNRAKHAVLEATILATRLHLTERADIQQALAGLASAIEKTAGPREHQAWELVTKYIDSN
jgi:uncharacterized protein